MSLAAAKRGKGKIKPPRRFGQDANGQERWEPLSNAIREIHNHNASKLSFEENYRYAYNMVLCKQGDLLYNGVKALVIENLSKLTKAIIEPTYPRATSDPVERSQEGERFLKAVRAVWDDHVGSMSKLRDLLKYMDRVYIPAARQPVIWDAGQLIFLERIVRASPTRQHILSTLLDQVRLERDEYAINRSAVESCVNILLELTDVDNVSIYRKDFEPVFLKQSEEFYRAEGRELLGSLNASKYLEHVEKRLASEQSRTHHYLSSTTHTPLKRILESTLLTPHLHTIITLPNSGLDAMIDHLNFPSLSRLHTLFTMVPEGLQVLKKALKESIAVRGKEVNEMEGGDGDGGDAEEEGEGEDHGGGGKGKGKERAPPISGKQSSAAALKWVADVLELKDKFDRILKTCFKNDIVIQSATNEAFESFINLNPKAPEYISLFIDENLKKGLKGKTDDEVELILTRTITIFRYLSEKDLFERYYKSHLAKRLLQNKSVSDDAEKGMLSKLKVECGYQFTQKLEGMFHDIKISNDLMAAYREYIEKTSRPAIEISVQVLTSTFWPMSQLPSPVILPQSLLRSCNSFEHFYFSRHSGRRLSWQSNLGNADVRASFAKGRKYDLNVSTYALILLLLFEDVEEDYSLSYEDIKAATQIPDLELQRNLQSLACAKFKILRKHPAGRDVHPDDEFSFNKDFSSPMQRIKISTIAGKVESGEERKETRGKVDEERRHQTEACIVRVMKDRKQMTHNDLITETTRQLASRFQPNPTQIKKRIEALIEREYLDRTSDRKSYTYLA